MGLKKTTSYEDFYEWLKLYEFDKIELKDNRIVKNIFDKNYWCDFEEALIETYNTTDNDSNINELIKQKLMIEGYFEDFIKLFCEFRLRHYCNEDFIKEFIISISNFYDRVFSVKKNNLKKYLNKKLDKVGEVSIDFINFNGTDILENIIKVIKNKNIMLRFSDNYNLKINNIYYVHGKLRTPGDKYSLGTTNLVDLRSSFNVDDKFRDMFLKTNSNFEEWVKNTDIFVCHGLSFGYTDKYYWDIISNEISKGKFLIDFPYVTGDIKSSDKAIEKLIHEREKKFTYDHDVETNNRIVVSIDKEVKKDEGSSGIFSFSN